MGRKTFLTNEIYECGILLKDQHQCFLICLFRVHIRVRKDELDFVHREAITNDVLSDLYRGSLPRQYLEGSNIHRMNLCLRLEGLDLFVKISAIELG